MKNLTVLDLSSNLFTGTIPSSIGGLTQHVDRNGFTGAMPQAICDLRNPPGPGSLTDLTADCAGATPEVTCAFPTCCTACF